MKTYTNPRLYAEIENWPSGKHRVTAIFGIERDEKNDRERAIRTTTGATKKLTYATKARIVDGDDGRTYIAEWSRGYGFITIMRGDMKLQEEVIFDRDPRHGPLLESLFGIV